MVSYVVSPEFLVEVVRARLDGPALAWWERSLERSADRSSLCAASAGAGRRLGRVPVALGGDERQRLGEAAAAVEGQSLAHVGRLTLMAVGLAQLPAEEQADLLGELFRTGALEERIAVLRALPWFPEPERFAAVAAAGVRTNAADILEAIACDNPFPAEVFDESAFNQLAMKAVFYELPLGRVVGLEERVNPTLIQMARDFADERRAARRPVPADLQLIDKGIRP